MLLSLTHSSRLAALDACFGGFFFFTQTREAAMLTPTPIRRYKVVEGNNQVQRVSVTSIGIHDGVKFTTT
jgi:hypothetical protein